MADVSPMSRDEKLLRKLLGQQIQTEAPQSRIEVLLQQLIDQGGTGGSYGIKGSYDTAAELEAAHPTGSAGDAYLVGSPSHVYVWLTEDEEWSDAGAFTAIAGPNGVGITSIEKTGTSGLVDTYTITYTDGDTDTFTVTNGAQGDPGAPGADGADGAPGVGIVSIAKTATVGLVDTYTITLSNGDTYDFTVTNGQDGSGADYSSQIASLSTAESQHTSQIASLSTENSTQGSELESLSTENSHAAISMSEISSTAASTSAAQSQKDSTQDSLLASASTAQSEMNSEIETLKSEVADAGNGYPIPSNP